MRVYNWRKIEGLHTTLTTAYEMFTPIDDISLNELSDYLAILLKILLKFF